ncbi:hypothetical protein ABT56_21520 [Photobacterium aquae]|uniref:DUF805 domain-containing protein n=1 Tax=Photobacterium aquae TaxID=1195763 RepID=A0A0J1GSC8_9GAMM|nr:hypothetical protein [Photobacterium aquae]KLV02334.1 hypothetical protein ABT56_21520 [Photobacterium aquae]
MARFKILYKDDVVLTVNMDDEFCIEEIKSLQEQGFIPIDNEINASSSQSAISDFYSSFPKMYSDNPLTITNVLLFRTNKMQRLAYLGYSIIATVFMFIFCTVAIKRIYDYAQYSHYGSDDIGFGAILLFLLLFFINFWVLIAIAISRWKNCGNSGWTYLLALVGVFIADYYLMGSAITILNIYLLLVPQDIKARLPSHVEKTITI